MRATESLSSDHRLIERVISSLAAAADRLESGQEVRPQFFLDVVRFIRGFADGAHHRKEEEVLFPTMAAHGMPLEAGPIAVMLFEHERGRELTAGLAAGAEQLAAGEAQAAAEVVASARGYAALLRQHIFKEDNILFAMARQVIPSAEHDAVLARFGALDRKQRDGERRDDYVALAERLEREVAARPGDSTTTSAASAPSAMQRVA